MRRVRHVLVCALGLCLGEAHAGVAQGNGGCYEARTPGGAKVYCGKAVAETPDGKVFTPKAGRRCECGLFLTLGPSPMPLDGIDIAASCSGHSIASVTLPDHATGELVVEGWAGTSFVVLGRALPGQPFVVSGGAIGAAGASTGSPLPGPIALPAPSAGLGGGTAPTAGGAGTGMLLGPGAVPSGYARIRVRGIHMGQDIDLTDPVGFPVGIGMSDGSTFVGTIDAFSSAMPIELFATLPISAGSVELFWFGGSGPFVLQVAVSPAGPWMDVAQTWSTSLQVPNSPGPVYFRVESHEGTASTALSGEPTSWWDQAGGHSGSLGEPLLEATGTLSPGTLNIVSLGNAVPFSPLVMLVASASTPVAFKGGVLKPFPFDLLLPGATGGEGDMSLPFLAPIGLPTGTTLWLQALVSDPGASNGVAISNALAGEVP